MKRVVLKLGIVDEPEPLALQAAARTLDPPGRWLNARLSLSTLVTILTLGASAVTGYVTLKVHQADQDAMLADLRGQVVRLNRHVTEDTVPRSTFDANTAQLNLSLTNLMQGQQQIYALLFQGTLNPRIPKGSPLP